MKRFLKKTHLRSQGFSLVEFIVIISIFAIMAGVALFNFRGFNSSVSLNNLAHDIALTIRQAQVYGISASEGESANPVSQVRGVYFPYIGTGFDTEFVIFLNTDLNAIITYDGPNIDVDLDRVAITTQDRIAAIEYSNDAISFSPCNSGFVVAFKRPNPDPLIFCGGTLVNFARITVQKPGTIEEKFIEIWPTGQIAVVNTPTFSGTPI